MKTFEVTVRVRNNLLKERRLALGLHQHGFAKAAGISHNAYRELECMMRPARGLGGEWRQVARDVALFLDVEPHEIFPAEVDAVKAPVAVRKMDAEEASLLVSSHQRLLAAGPEEVRQRNELRSAVQVMVSELNKRESDILARRFGLDGYAPETLEELALRYRLSRERIRGIEAKAMYRIRHPKSKFHQRIKEFIPGR